MLVVWLLRCVDRMSCGGFPLLTSVWLQPVEWQHVSVTRSSSGGLRMIEDMQMISVLLVSYSVLFGDK